MAPGGCVADVRVAGAMPPSGGAGQSPRTGATCRADAAGQRSSPGNQVAQFAEGAQRNSAPERAHRTKETRTSGTPLLTRLVSGSPSGMRVLGSHGTAEAGMAKTSSALPGRTGATGIAGSSEEVSSRCAKASLASSTVRGGPSKDSETPPPARPQPTPSRGEADRNLDTHTTAVQLQVAAERRNAPQVVNRVLDGAETVRRAATRAPAAPQAGDGQLEASHYARPAVARLESVVDPPRRGRSRGQWPRD